MFQCIFWGRFHFFVLLHITDLSCENDVSFNTEPEQDGRRGIQPAILRDAARLPAFLVLTSEGFPQITAKRFPSIISDEGHGGQSPQEEGRSSPEEARGLQHPGGFLMCDAV